MSSPGCSPTNAGVTRHALGSHPAKKAARRLFLDPESDGPLTVSSPIRSISAQQLSRPSSCESIPGPMDPLASASDSDSGIFCSPLRKSAVSCLQFQTSPNGPTLATAPSLHASSLADTRMVLTKGTRSATSSPGRRLSFGRHHHKRHHNINTQGDDDDDNDDDNDLSLAHLSKHPGLTAVASSLASLNASTTTSRPHAVPLPLDDDTHATTASPPPTPRKTPLVRRRPVNLHLSFQLDERPRPFHASSATHLPPHQQQASGPVRPLSPMRFRLNSDMHPRCQSVPIDIPVGALHRGAAAANTGSGHNINPFTPEATARRKRFRDSSAHHPHINSSTTAAPSATAATTTSTTTTTTTSSAMLLGDDDPSTMAVSLPASPAAFTRQRRALSLNGPQALPAPVPSGTTTAHKRQLFASDADLHANATVPPPSKRVCLAPPSQSVSDTLPSRSPSPSHSSLARTVSSDTSAVYKAQNISRYKQEFEHIEQIGAGHYGVISKCMNRLDGCYYAIKRSKKPVRGVREEQALLREVYAHAVLGVNEHIVRYYSAWEENDHIFIQSEFCNGLSLADGAAKGKPYSEPELCDLLLQVAEGLYCMHLKRLVHLDIKPSNIFVSLPLPPIPQTALPLDTSSIQPPLSANAPHSDPFFTFPPSAAPSRPLSPFLFAALSPPSLGTRVCYKIGDLGHVTSIDVRDVSEGDSRYLSREILQEDYSDLRKGDIFALGMSMIELAMRSDLPSQGEGWQSFRDGNVPPLPAYSKEFHALLKSMIDPSPRARPSAKDLVRHAHVRTRARSLHGSALSSSTSSALQGPTQPLTTPLAASSTAPAALSSSFKTPAQLAVELSAERLKNSLLERELAEARREAAEARAQLTQCQSTGDALASTERTATRALASSIASSSSASSFPSALPSVVDSPPSSPSSDIPVPLPTHSSAIFRQRSRSYSAPNVKLSRSLSMPVPRPTH